MEQQIDKSSFDKLDLDPSSEKQSDKINENWREFNKPDNCKACKNYGVVKNHKDDNPLRVITSGCSTAV